ncbi:MAG TPA: PaaI family thioesterase [Atribacteraceae bacterium]|nr:PaaI family thioesterase [Atribacteraceae bacterium]
MNTCLAGIVPWHFQGLQGVVYGGIVSALLDEAVSHSIKAAGEMAVTGTLEVRFLKPCRTEIPLRACARITRKKEKTIETAGELIQDQAIVAEGKAVFVKSSCEVKDSGT